MQADLGSEFEEEASIDTEYTDGEILWNENGLRRSGYFRKRHKKGETFDLWLKSVLRAGSLRKLEFLTYGLPIDVDDDDHALYRIAERRIVDSGLGVGGNHLWRDCRRLSPCSVDPSSYFCTSSFASGQQPSVTTRSRIQEKMTYRSPTLDAVWFSARRRSV
jgi:hypothetical protein